MTAYQQLVAHILRVHGGGFKRACRLADLVFEGKQRKEGVTHGT